jgi:predicted enzyme related to lactoylglutathione lyase
MEPSLNKIIIYAKNPEKMVRFYEQHFGFTAHIEEDDRITELIPKHGASSLMIHPAEKRVKEGQSCVKLVFDIRDVEGFRETCIANRLKFRVLHQADRYVFSNAKDPGKNSIQISNRAFRK